jgi:carboxyl-terminal processing protease
MMNQKTPLQKFHNIFITFLLVLSAFFGGWYLGKRGYIYEVRKNPPKLEVTNRYPNDTKIDFALFWQVWDLLEAEYLERPVDGQAMLYGAIQGMVNSLGDPYTSFLPPEVNETVHNALNGTYEGIGAELGLEDGRLMIVSPLDGSPALAAGVKAGDRIVKIEDAPTVGITITEAVSKIRGEAGTISSLTLQRGTEEPFVVRIKRGNIVIEGVKWEDKGNGIAYIRVSRFGEDTNKEWSKVVAKVNVEMDNLDAIILDVRGNPGGYLQSAVFLAGEFFRNDTVTIQESATGSKSPYDTTRVGVLEGLPVYVLIDGGSASASEILAGALKDNIGAILVGTKSFGKGTIQDAKQFDDGSGVHITVAKWLTPDGVWVHKEGIEPHVSVERNAEDMEAGIDAQLNKAIELATQGIIEVKDIPSEETANE